MQIEVRVYANMASGLLAVFLVKTKTSIFSLNGTNSTRNILHQRSLAVECFLHINGPFGSINDMIPLIFTPR